MVFRPRRHIHGRILRKRFRLPGLSGRAQISGRCIGTGSQDAVPLRLPQDPAGRIGEGGPQIPRGNDLFSDIGIRHIRADDPAAVDIQPHSIALSLYFRPGPPGYRTFRAFIRQPHDRAFDRLAVGIGEIPAARIIGQVDFLRTVIDQKVLDVIRRHDGLQALEHILGGDASLRRVRRGQHRNIRIAAEQCRQRIFVGLQNAVQIPDLRGGRLGKRLAGIRLHGSAGIAENRRQKDRQENEINGQRGLNRADERVLFPRPALLLLLCRRVLFRAHYRSPLCFPPRSDSRRAALRKPDPGSGQMFRTIPSQAIWKPSFSVS